jgi:hypothetical protein
MKIYYNIKGGMEAFKKIKSGYLIEVSREKISQLGESIIRYPFERPWNVSLKSVIKETLQNFQSGTLDNIFEYTWSNPDEAKKELKELSREVNIIAFLVLNEKGWSIAKVPNKEGEWITIKVPVATKFFVIKNEEDIKKIQEELSKEKFPLAKLLNLEVEITFTEIDSGIDEPYSLKITNTFEMVLGALIKSKVEKKYDKVDLKVHIKGTRVTMKHYGAPVALLKHLILKYIASSHALIEKGIVGGRAQYVFEFP